MNDFKVWWVKYWVQSWIPHYAPLLTKIIWEYLWVVGFVLLLERIEGVFLFKKESRHFTKLSSYL